MTQPQTTNKQIFIRFICDKGLKFTRQREIILTAFLSYRGHVGIDQFYWDLQVRNPRIGHTTVYRTLKLFEESGIARGVRFADGQIRYEQVSDSGHHDHMICRLCGSIEEFSNEQLEEMQTRLAANRGFLLESKKTEMYGICAGCRQA